MASFNPVPPDIQPQNWERQSRAIPQPESITKADTSLGQTLTTVASGLDSAVGIGSDIQNDIIKEKVRAGVEEKRDSYTAALTKVRDQQIAGIAPTPESLKAAGIDTLGIEDTTPVPGGLQSGIARAQALGTAMAQNGGGGKANDTLYTGALNALAKNLRNQYPGSKDFIDAQIAKVSGKDPANAFYENLLQDINRGLGAGKGQQDKDHAFIDKYIDTIPGMDVMRRKYDNGTASSEDLRDYVAQKSALKINQTAAEAARAALKSQGELTVTRVKQDFAKEAGDTINDAFQTQREFSDTKTPKEIADFFQGQATGQIPQLDENTNRLWLTNLAAQRDTAAAKLREIALRIPKDDQGNVIGDSYAKSAGGLHNLKDEMNEQLSLYDNVIARVKDKDYMGVYFVLNQNNAIHNQANNELYNAGDGVGATTRRMQAVTDAVGPQTGAILLRDAIESGMDKKYTSYVGGVKMDALSQPNPAAPTTMYDAMENARNKKIADPGVYKSFVDIAKIIADPAVKDQGKVNAATFAFGGNAKNLQSLNHFSNPEDRKTAFMSMTDKSVTDGIANLPVKTQQEYRTWAEKTGAGIIGRDAIADLSAIKDQKYLQSYHIAWNTGDKTNPPHFDVINKNGSPLTEIQQSYARPVTEVVKKVNDVVGNLSHIEKSAGGDVNAYVVGVLSRSGFDFRNNVEGIPNKMMDALLNANRDPKKPPIDSTVKPPISQPNFNDRFDASFPNR